MGVQVHRQVELRAQRGDQGAGRGRAQQPGHVLDRQHVRAGVDDPRRELQVVVERVELLVRVRQVAGVAERHLGDGAPGRADRLDRRPHLLDVVERVEDPEHVDAGGRGLLDERGGDLGRVRRVADGVAPAQQHLEAHVGRRLPQRRQPLPRVLGQEAQRHVVRRAAPRLDRPELRGQPGHVAGDREQVVGADPGGEQALVGVAERRVGDRDPLLLAQCRREPLGPEPEQLLARAVGCRHGEVELRQLERRVEPGRRRAVRLVDRHVGEVGQQLGAAVRAGPGGQQLRVVLDERGGEPSRPDEVRVVEDRLQERDVRGDAADPELRDRTPGPVDGLVEGPAATGQLGQHRVEVRGDLGAGVRRTAVEADARPAGGAVRRDLARVGPEAVGGVLGGDPALQRRAAELDGVLGEAEVGQRLAGRDPDLRLHQVDVGDLLGHGVLDLDAGVHLDEDVVPVRVQQELHGARVAVADLLREADRVGAHPVAQLGRQVRGRGDLDDLLVPPLHRAVALEQVDHVALAVGEDLHLDVPRLDDRLLDEHGRVAERGVALAHAGLDRLAQVPGVVDPAHAAATAAGDRLHEQRVAHPLARPRSARRRRWTGPRSPASGRRRPWRRRSPAPCCRSGSARRRSGR